jgi:cytoskeletal protein CcmA (bactofilin family)
MFGSAKKVPTSCPHCGFVQLEPRELISTYCRGCGDHFSVTPQPALAPAAKPPAAKAALVELLREKLHIHQQRNVACLECGRDHSVSAHLRFAQCPTCGAAIDLHDVEITGHSTRIVETHGTVHVGPEGFLNSTRITCGQAIVEGRVAGKITCFGTLRLKGQGICRSQIRTRQLVVDRGAEVRIPYTIYAEDVILRGRVEADIHCAGTIHIGRYGGLDGDVQARAMRVDKGGFYTGQVEISTGTSLPAPAAPRQAEVRVIPGWQTRLAFS